MSFSKLLLIALLLIGSTGCSIFQEQDETAGWSVEQFYAEAKDALNSKDYARAIELYKKLEARYPYGRYTQQAQLETAYAHYKAAERESAIAAAERFISLHPRHPNVDYAYYLRGLASFQEGNGFLERFLPQDPATRDPSAARESFGYFRELIERFPNSRYRADAVARMTKLRNDLARSEVLVADYYLRRGAHMAAANRGKYVVENYQGTPAVADALEVMVKAYRSLGQQNLASDALRVLELNHPEHPGLEELRQPVAATPVVPADE